MLAMQQDSHSISMSVRVCTADPVSVCYCTSYDLVQCRGNGGRGSDGRGDIQDPSLQFSLLQYVISQSIHTHALYSFVELRDAELQISSHTRCATASLHNFGPCTCNR